ncbi:MAG: DNA-directed RNA polymerase [Candidatus Aenigmarchaeota archaeon]|nr:DNA-directed RNA polymerase [Candidatus Aenigmarchaeota archaeon]
MSFEGRDNFKREFHKATCSDCGNECEVPFKPSEDRPVYCRDCFQKHKKPRKF